MTLSTARVLLAAFALLSLAWGFQPSPHRRALQRRRIALKAALKVGKNYDPKWKKKLTIAEQAELEGKKIKPEDVGLKGSISVVFKQGNFTKSTVAMPGQPIRDVATQAGQFIKYGCGKGECGTCEAMCDGKWIRPCQAVVPADIPEGQEYVIQVKEIKNVSKSSGKFFSVRSFIKGFWNNLLGMAGFVRDRKAAKKNWEERQEYEAALAKKIAEKKAARAAAEAAKKLSS